MSEIKIKYQRRKTLKLQVLSDGTTLVTAPTGCPRLMIEQFVKKNERWLARQREAALKRAEKAASVPRTLRVMGRELPVRAVPGGTVQIDLEKGEVLLPENVPLMQLYEPLGRCYASLGREYLPARTAYWAERFQLRVEKVTVTSARRRWGSCTPQRHTLHFSRWLMMASEKAIDSVIIHELMHLIEPNHSPAFRALVQKNTPDYQACEKELKALAKEIPADQP